MFSNDSKLCRYTKWKPVITTETRTNYTGKRKQILVQKTSLNAAWVCASVCVRVWANSMLGSFVKYVTVVPHSADDEEEGDDDDEDILYCCCKESTNDRMRWMHQEKCKQTSHCMYDCRMKFQRWNFRYLNVTKFKKYSYTFLRIYDNNFTYSH